MNLHRTRIDVLTSPSFIEREDMVNIGGDCKLRLIEKKDNETSFRSHGKNG